jgi:hypothetical protein
MDTFAEIREAVTSDLTIGSESSLYPTATVDMAINRAYTKAGALFPWPELMDAKTTTTQAVEYYDYPSNWRSNSIWKLTIDGVRYGEDPDGSPLSYDDFMNWKEDNSTATDKKWANQWRRYFISPTTTAGLTLCIWGIMVTEKLVENADVTIFSYSMQECNEAIILEAVAILKAKGEQEKAGEFRSLEAKQILAMAWGKIRTENAKYEKIQPFFDVPNFFSGNGNGSNEDMRGKF